MPVVKLVVRALLLSTGLFLYGHTGDGEILNSRISVTAVVYDDGWQGMLRSPSALFFDRQARELFVADAGNNRVLVYNEDLTPKYSFEHFVRDKNSDRMVKGEPRAMVVNSLGEIILADNLVGYIDVLDFRGKLLERVYLNRLLGDTSLWIKPQSLAIDAAGNLYVATVGDVVTVVVLDSYFDLKRTIGKKGSGPSDFNTPLSIYVWKDLLYVTDLYARPAIKIFDTGGEFRSGFGAHDIERSDVSFPSGIAVLENKAGDCSIWIVDGLRQVIKVFDQQGKFLAHVGGFGFNPGEFRYPVDIVAASDSLFFVVERVGNRVQRFEIR